MGTVSTPSPIQTDTACKETVGTVHKYYLKMYTDINAGAPHSGNLNAITIFRYICC